MSNSIQLRNDLVQELRDIRSKHTYFLMAAAGASLGFGVQKLDGQVPGQPLLVGLAAMLLWILSFAFGCFAMTATQAVLPANIDLFNSMERGDSAAAEKAHQLALLQLHRSKRNHFYQFATLALGVVLFAAWRVLLIYHPSYSPSCIP